MLANFDAATNIGVRDLARASRFYREVIGLEQVYADGENVIVFRSGNSNLLVYRSDFAGTNQATTLTWTVGDNVDSLVQQLKDRGINFEHYDLPDVSRE